MSFYIDSFARSAGQKQRFQLGLGNQRGQSTVEAVLTIPIIFLLLLVLAQPAILLYNRIVMENAAAESCRLLATRTEFGAYSADKYQGYVLRRLAAVPPLAIFHISTSNNGWQVELIGNESSATVTVRITNRLQPLPLVGWGAALLRLTDADGYLVQIVEATMPSQPSWVWQDGGGPASWPLNW
ncbi:MAG: pilus assembly protein [Actinomycetia bacterium]|nr:pilus assembly protein [Actinomycetes bacterium]